jgi:hypothetical protein
MAKVLAAEGARILPGTEVVITIVPAERPDTFKVIAGEGPWARKLIGKEWPLHEGMLHGRAMIGNRIIETADAPAESAAPQVFEPGRISVGRLVPLGMGRPFPDGRVGMGVIGFWKPGSVPFSAEEREIIDTFSRMASMGLLRSEARLATNRLAERMRVAADITQELATTLDAPSVHALWSVGDKRQQPFGW